MRMGKAFGIGLEEGFCGDRTEEWMGGGGLQRDVKN